MRKWLAKWISKHIELPKEVVYVDLPRDKAIEQVVYLLRETELTIAERNLLTGCLLDTLDALPLRGTISLSESGEILIHGEALDIEKARMFREFANSALDNKSLKLVWEQVRWLAFKEGLATGLPPESLLFYRAAIWFSDQTKQHLQILAQRESEVL